MAKLRAVLLLTLAVAATVNAEAPVEAKHLYSAPHEEIDSPVFQLPVQSYGPPLPPVPVYEAPVEVHEAVHHEVHHAPVHTVHHAPVHTVHHAPVHAAPKAILPVPLIPKKPLLLKPLIAKKPLLLKPFVKLHKKKAVAKKVAKVAAAAVVVSKVAKVAAAAAAAKAVVVKTKGKLAKFIKH